MLGNLKHGAAKAGVTDVCVHDLRRSPNTHRARKPAVPIVKELAGHSDVKRTLRHYVTIRESDVAKAREVTAHALAV